MVKDDEQFQKSLYAKFALAAAILGFNIVGLGVLDNGSALGPIKWIAASLSLAIVMILPVYLLSIPFIHMKKSGIRISLEETQERNATFVKLLLIGIMVFCLAYASAILWAYAVVVRSLGLAIGLGMALETSLWLVRGRIIRSIGAYWQEHA